MANDNDTSTELGRWEGGDFEATVSLSGGVGFGADLPEVNRFVTGVVQLLRRRAAELERSCESDDVDIAVFVLKSLPPDSITNAQREPMFDSGLIKVNGRLWFTTASVASGYYVNLPQGSDNERFSYVANVPGLGTQPTLLFEPRTMAPELRWYPEGLGKPEKRELLPLEGVVEPGDVLSAIDQVYKQCFIVPGGLPQGVSLWHDSSRYWPLEDAESQVQSYLKVGLAMKFPYCTIRHEQTHLTGRTDLEIEQQDTLDRSVYVRHAVLELKVLRSFWSTGSTVSDTKTKEWISEGVRQAAAYCSENGFQWSALCCFDMRENDVGDGASFAHVRERADSLDVMLKRWFLYASAAELRRAVTSLA